MQMTSCTFGAYTGPVWSQRQNNQLQFFFSFENCYANDNLRCWCLHRACLFPETEKSKVPVVYKALHPWRVSSIVIDSVCRQGTKQTGLLIPVSLFPNCRVQAELSVNFHMLWNDTRFGKLFNTLITTKEFHSCVCSDIKFQTFWHREWFVA